MKNKTYILRNPVEWYYPGLFLSPFATMGLGMFFSYLDPGSRPSGLVMFLCFVPIILVFLRCAMVVLEGRGPAKGVISGESDASSPEGTGSSAVSVRLEDRLWAIGELESRGLLTEEEARRKRQEAQDEV